MAEKEKESSWYRKSEKGTALLDLDIEKDFLTSSKSVAEDDQMDNDFCTVAEGNKEPFEFDNMDKDNKLEDDFGKTSSINVDISDHDISFPVEKAGKPSGKSKEVLAEKKIHEKSDRFGKIAKKTNANQDAEPSPSLSGTLGFGTLLKETNGASEGDTTSKFDSQLGGEPNSLSKEKSHTSLTDVHLPSKSDITSDQATNLGATTSQKPISGSTLEADQDSCQKERNTLQEPYKETCQNSSLQFVSETSSTYLTAHSSTEEVGCLARKERTKTDGEQSISGVQTDFGFNCGNLRLHKLPLDITCLQSNGGECSQFSGDNPVGIDNNDEAEPTASKKMVIQTDGETMESSLYQRSEKGTALLDLDIEKDFLTSSKSVDKDNQMDIDFCTVAKGNKEPFEFDNMDKDFRLEDDFGKTSLINVDISDYDVSFPVENARKPSGMSKEVSAEKKTQEKSDWSTPKFDFDVFGMIAKKTNPNQDAEPSPSLSGSLGFGTLLKETIGASEGDTTSKFDSQLGGEPNSLSKEKSHTSLTDVHLPSKSEIPKDQATYLGARTSQKPISGSTQEADQDSCQMVRYTQQEPYKETCQISSPQFVSETSSTTYQTAHSSTEEVGILARQERIKTDGEQSISGVKTDFGFNCGNLPLDKLPVDITCLQSNDGECSQFSGDNPVGIDNNDDAEPTASKKMVIQTDGETMESASYQRSEKGTALLDLDIEKDFLNSSKSVAEDDKMDIDFCAVSEGNKEPFEFDKMDKDFRLQEDFGKTSSLNVHISDHDVSFPVEKAGKPSRMSKEVSAEKKTQEKSDQPTPQFDFDVFGKIAKKTNANQDAEPSPSLSGSLGFGTLLKETIGASVGDTTSKFDSQLGGELNSLSKEKSHTSLTDVHLPSKSEIPKDQATYLGATTSQKPISGSTQEADQDVWCVDTNLEDLIVPRNTSISTRFLLELERRAPPSIKKLSPSEKLLKLKATVAKYVRSDEEKQRKLLEKDLERSRERISLQFTKVANGIYNIVPGDFFLRPFREALDANTAESIRQVVGVSDGVLILRMMLRAPCREIAAEVKRFRSWCEKNDFHPLPPSSIYEHGVVLGYFGLDRMIAQLVENYLQPIINVFFGFVGRIDQHFSFCVEFGADKHNHIDLNYHDDSDITLKLCLTCAEDCTGADLQFGEARCSGHETIAEPPLNTVFLDMGYAVMHCGRHRNGVLPVDQAATKQYLVIWMKSSEFEEMEAFKREHPDWCSICKQIKKERAEQYKSDLVKSLSRIVSSDSCGPPSKKARRT